MLKGIAHSYDENGDRLGDRRTIINEKESIDFRHIQGRWYVAINHRDV